MRRACSGAVKRGHREGSRNLCHYSGQEQSPGIQQQSLISIKDLPGMFCNWVSGAPPASDQPHSRRPLQTGRTELEQELQQRKINVMGDATGVTASSCSCACTHPRAGNKAQAETQHEQGLETSCSIRVKLFIQLTWQTNISNDNHILWCVQKKNQKGLEKEIYRMSPILFSAKCGTASFACFDTCQRVFVTQRQSARCLGESRIDFSGCFS